MEVADELMQIITLGRALWEQNRLLAWFDINHPAIARRIKARFAGTDAIKFQHIPPGDHRWLQVFGAEVIDVDPLRGNPDFFGEDIETVVMNIFDRTVVSSHEHLDKPSPG